MIDALFALSLFGILTSTVYTGLAMKAATLFLRRRRAEPLNELTPAVSLLKPLYGYEQDMESHLETFFDQDYPTFEILFCAREENDPALAAARRVAERHPEVPVKFLFCGEPPYPNAKVRSLECMQGAARHEILVVSDSDVSVGREYLRSVVAPFTEERVGLVTCIYRGVAMAPSAGSKASTLWSKLEAAGMSVEMSAGVLVAEMLEDMQFALGPTMVVRRRSLEKIGGFAVLGDYHADDFMLGNLIAAAGDKVQLSTYIVEHHILNASFGSSSEHQIRWMKSTRVSRPKGHFGTVLTYSMPYAVLAAVLALALHRPVLAAALFGWGWMTRALLAMIVGGAVVREPSVWRVMLLYPMRDLLGFFFWCASYLGDEVEWRGEVYKILSNGRMVNCNQPADAEAKPAAVLTT